MSKENLEQLFQLALTTRKRAYAPYSGFLVGAVIVGSTGEVFAGCNVENSSYGGAICAERNAICAMVAAGVQSFTELLVVTDTPDGCAPCGICRQVLSEFAKDRHAVKIHIANLKGVTKTYSLDELLPNAFDSLHLTKVLASK